MVQATCGSVWSSRLWRRLLAGLAAAGAALAMGCNTAAVPLTLRVQPLEAQPAEVTLDATGTATVRLKFGLRVTGSDVEWTFACGPLTGLPPEVRGFAVVEGNLLGDCNASGTNASDLDAAFTIVLTLRTALGANPAPGRYTVTQTAVASADDQVFLPGRGSYTTREGALSFVVVVPDPASPPPPPPPPPAGPQAWVPLGAAPNGLDGALNVDATSYTQGPALAVDAAGLATAAWVENDRLVVRRWDGAAWQTLGAGLSGGIALGRPALALDGTGAPMVAWNEARTTDANGATRVQVRRWDGSSWQPMGATPVDSADATDARDPAWLLHNGQIFLAWAERTASEGGERIALRGWSGGNWLAVPATGELSAPGRPVRVTLTTLDGGTLAVAWQDDSNRRVHVAGLQGNRWVALGSFAASNTQSFALQNTALGLLIAIAPSPPERQFTVQRFNGAGWAGFGSVQGQPAVTAAVAALALATDAATGEPLLAWIQFDATRRFEVRRWSGGDWAALGDPLQPRARLSLGTPTALSLLGGPRPLLATEVSTTTPADRAVRVYEYR